MAVWISTIYLVSWYICATLACKGCQFKDFNFTSCSDTTADIMEFTWESMQMTEDCQIQTNFSRVMKVHMTSAKIKIVGDVNGLPYSYENPNLCKAMEEKNFDGKDVSSVLQQYHIADGCNRPEDLSKLEVRKKKMSDDLAKIVDKGKGPSHVKIELLDVNGKEGFNACFEVKANIDCDPPNNKRKPKNH